MTKRVSAEEEALVRAFIVPDRRARVRGDPAYSGNVQHYFTTEHGVPTMLEAADPPNRAEMERRQAAKAQRRQEKADAAKAHYQRLRAAK